MQTVKPALRHGVNIGAQFTSNILIAFMQTISAGQGVISQFVSWNDDNHMRVLFSERHGSVTVGAVASQQKGHGFNSPVPVRFCAEFAGTPASSHTFKTCF